MELRHLRHFVAAAEEGHFGRAARREHISAPGLGQQIKELEEELGVDLFERLPRGVQLTAAGTAFLSDARRMLCELRAAIEHAQDQGRGKRGRLCVGHVPMILQQGMGVGNIIPAFCVRYPEVEVRSIDLSVAEQYAALAERRIDVGIVYADPESGWGFRSEVLAEYFLDGALLPSTHALTRKTPLHCRDLSVLPLLRAPADTFPTGEDPMLRELRARGLDVASDVEHQSTDFIVRIGLVAAGAGWMPANAAVAKLLTDVHGIVFRPWADAPIRYPCCVVWRPSDRSALVANFIASCRELRDSATVDVTTRLGVA